MSVPTNALSSTFRRRSLIGLAFAMLGGVVASWLCRDQGVRLLDIAVMVDLVVVLPAMFLLFRAAGIRWV